MNVNLIKVKGDPVDLKIIRTYNKFGEEKVVPALNIGFAEERHYVHFQRPTKFESKEERDLWFEHVDAVEEDFNWLLGLCHQRFWAQVSNDILLIFFLTSYITYAPRFFEQNLYIEEGEMTDIFRRIHGKALKIFLRLSHFIETELCHLSREGWRNIIYPNRVYSIGSILDLCVLYNLHDHGIVAQIIENVFTYEPNFCNEMEEVLKEITLELKRHVENFDKVNSRPNFKKGKAKKKYLRDLTFPRLKEIVATITDYIVTLYSFLSVYSTAKLPFKFINFTNIMPYFYERLIPPLIEEVEHRATLKSKDEVNPLLLSLQTASDHFLYIVHVVKKHGCLKPLLTERDKCENGLLFESYCILVKSITGTNKFWEAFSSKLAIRDDIPYLIRSKFAPDDNALELMNTLLESIYGEEIRLCQEDFLVSMDLPNSGDHVADKPITCNTICTLKDIFPTYSKYFLKECSIYYENDVENIIQAINENTLPSHIAILQFSKEPEENPVDLQNGLGDLFENDTDDDDEDNQMRKILSERYDLPDPIYDDEYDDTYEEAYVTIVEFLHEDEFTTTFNSKMEKMTSYSKQYRGNDNSSDEMGEIAEDSDENSTKNQLSKIPFEKQERQSGKFSENINPKKRHAENFELRKRQNVRETTRRKSQVEQIQRNHEQKEINKPKVANTNHKSWRDKRNK